LERDTAVGQDIWTQLYIMRDKNFVVNCTVHTQEDIVIKPFIHEFILFEL